MIWRKTRTKATLVHVKVVKRRRASKIIRQHYHGPRVWLNVVHNVHLGIIKLQRKTMRLKKHPPKVV